MLECEQLDLLFIQSEQVVSENLLADRMIPANAYLGKVPDGGSFPIHSGTRIKGYRLGRIGVPMENGWQPVVDEQCQTNACDFEPEVISHGSSEFFYSLVQRDFRTDWICIDSMQLRAFPEQEMEHLEQGFRDAARHIHEEFRRSRFILFSENKYVAKVNLVEAAVPDSQTQCTDENINDQGFVFETRPSGEMNENLVRVAVPITEINQIAGLSLDLLDQAQERLEYTHESYMPDTRLYDVLLAHGKTANILAKEEDENMNGAGSHTEGGYNLLDLSQTYGTERVLRNYSLRRDMYAMRFYPDVTFNTALAASEGYEFDIEDPDTWPRFVRVHPYVMRKDTRGVKYVISNNYRRAPFGISVILSRRVMEVMSFPDIRSVGGASKVGGVGWDGTVQWKNPDWTCNIKRNKGFFLQSYRLAGRPNYTDEGHVFFHRINPQIILSGVPCAPQAISVEPFVTPYCFPGMGEEFANGANLAIDN